MLVGGFPCADFVWCDGDTYWSAKSQLTCSEQKVAQVFFLHCAKTKGAPCATIIETGEQKLGNWRRASPLGGWGQVGQGRVAGG